MKIFQFIALDCYNKNQITAKPLRIRFDRVDRFIRGYHGTRYLVLFGSENMITFTTGSDMI